MNGGGRPENAQPSSTALNVSDINVEYLDDKSVALSVSAYGGSDLSYAWSYATSGAEISASGGDLIADGSSQSSAYTPMGDTGIVYFTALSPESDYHIKLFVQTVKAESVVKELDLKTLATVEINEHMTPRSTGIVAVIIVAILLAAAVLLYLFVIRKHFDVGAFITPAYFQEAWSSQRQSASCIRRHVLSGRPVRQ